MANTKKIFYFVLSPIILIGIVFLFSGCLKRGQGINYKINLEVWGVFDDSDAFEQINRKYMRATGQIQEIKYKKISSNFRDFEKEILDAIATGKGPDIIFFHNSWLLEHKNKVTPLPQSEAQLANFRQTFVDVAEKDFVEDNQIYAMPLYCDTLALYYNKNLLNQAGLASPPRTWKELEIDVPLLTEIDRYGNIEKSAIPLGRSKEPGGINRASDILSLLMMQNGVSLLNEKNAVAEFARNEGSREALNFYTKFAQGGTDAYTWNSNMDYSIDSFRYGKTAMMLNYSYWANHFRKTDPKFDFNVALAPQKKTDNRTDFANYWGLAVVNNKDLTLNVARRGGQVNFTNEDRVKEAWEYIKYLTAGTGKTENFDPTEIYLSETAKPAARRDLVEKQLEDPYMKIFAQQALTAQSWARPDSEQTDAILADMIDNVVSGKFSAYEALKTAQSRINNLLRD